MRGARSSSTLQRMAWRPLLLLACLALARLVCADEPGSYAGILQLRRPGFRMQHPLRKQELPKVHLFIGVPSHAPERRAAIRATWGAAATAQRGVVVRFFTSIDEASDEKEDCYKGEHMLTVRCGDTVFVGEQLLPGGGLLPGQNGVTQKVYLMFEHAVTHFDPDFVMKVDDDTFVNIPVVLSVLAAQAASGAHSALYFGHIAEGPDLEKEDMGDTAFASLIEDTLARLVIPPYAAGPAYVISGSAIQALVAVNNLVGLRHIYHEDIAVGMWLSGFLIRIVGESEAGVSIIDFLDLEKQEVPEKQRFCAHIVEQPLAWVHGLKRPGEMAAVHAAAAPCLTGNAVAMAGSH